MKQLAKWSLAILVACSAAAINTHAQVESALVVDAHMTDGHQYFELIGSGFPPGQKVRIRAVNSRTGEGVTMAPTSESNGGFAGVYVGRNADGDYYIPSSGTWRVRAKSGSTIARATFDVARRPTTGTYGGPEAELKVGSTSSTIALPCADARTDAPLLLDADGHFSVDGTFTESRGPVAGSERRAKIEGQRKGKTITFQIVVFIGDVARDTYGPFEVKLGRDATFQRCV